MVNVVSADLYTSACDSIHRPAVGIEFVLVLAVLVATFTDLRTRRIPNWLTVSTLAARIRVERVDRLPVAAGGLVAGHQGIRAGLRC